MPDLTSALDYLTAHPWAGWLALGAITLLLSRKSQIDAWAEAHPRVAGLHKLMRSLGIDPWMFLQSVSLIVKGRLPAPPKVKLPAPKDDDGPSTPKSGARIPTANPGVFALMLVAGALALTGALPACSPAATPEARGAQAASLVRLGYGGARVTLRELYAIHLGLQKAVTTPEQAQFAAPKLRIALDGLDRAKALLAKAKPFVASGKDEAEARRLLRGYLDELDALLPVLAGLGGLPSEEAGEALDLLRGFLGGAK